MVYHVWRFVSTVGRQILQTGRDDADGAVVDDFYVPTIAHLNAAHSARTEGLTILGANAPANMGALGLVWPVAVGP
jgi:hypothetical protein